MLRGSCSQFLQWGVSKGSQAEKVRRLEVFFWSASSQIDHGQGDLSDGGADGLLDMKALLEEWCSDILSKDLYLQKAGKTFSVEKPSDCWYENKE